MSNDPTSAVDQTDGCEDHCDAVPEMGLAREGKNAKPWNSAIQRTVPSERPKIDRIPRRWDRLIRLVGDAGMERLLQAHVMVVGLGGVGSYATEALARSGIGRLTLVDFDDVCVTNVNRQLQAFPGTTGQSKAKLLAKRVEQIHPEAFVEPIQAFYEFATADALLSPRPDFVVDAIDNVTAKLHLLQTCLERSIPVVSVTGAAARWDPTQIQVDDLSRTRIDPLARVIRKELGRRGIDTTQHVGIPVVFSVENLQEPTAPAWDAEDGFQCICPHQEDSPHACEKRRLIYGTASFVTAAFGMAASSVVVKAIANTEP